MKSIIGVLTGVIIATGGLLAPAVSAAPAASSTVEVPAEWRFHGYYNYSGCVSSMRSWAQELYPVDGCYSTPAGWFFYVYR